MRAGSRWLASLAFLPLLAVAACAPEARTLRCRRYDAAVLVPENNFATVVPAEGLSAIDGPPERIEVAMSIVRPLRDAITLVHVIGGREVERWKLRPPQGTSSTVQCRIAPTQKKSNCGAILSQVPHPPGGYYYLITGANNVFEAGLAFYLCD